jgi:predicted lipid-binding transport protein (Tim44 family)
MFDTIFDAFVNAKHYTLQEMLSNAMYEQFSRQIRKREEQNLRQEISIKHNKTSIGKIKVLERKASLMIEFDVTQMSAIVNGDGAPLDNPNKLSRNVRHIWIFERIYARADWVLSSTSVMGQ